jgi:hypothetical protein
VKFKPKIESITAKKLYSTLFPCKKMKKFAQRQARWETEGKGGTFTAWNQGGSEQ